MHSRIKLTQQSEYNEVGRFRCKVRLRVHLLIIINTKTVKILRLFAKLFKQKSSF